MNDTANLNDLLVKRLNDAVEAVAVGRLMQNSRPFTVLHLASQEQGLSGVDTIGFRYSLAPRDIEILADILEEVERGTFRPTNYAPTVNDRVLPLGVDLPAHG